MTGDRGQDSMTAHTIQLDGKVSIRREIAVSLRYKFSTLIDMPSKLCKFSLSLSLRDSGVFGGCKIRYVSETRATKWLCGLISYPSSWRLYSNCRRKWLLTRRVCYFNS